MQLTGIVSAPAQDPSPVGPHVPPTQSLFWDFLSLSLSSLLLAFLPPRQSCVYIFSLDNNAVCDILIFIIQN